MFSIQRELAREKHPEVLRQFSQWLHQDNERLRKEIALLKKQQYEAAQYSLGLKATLTKLRKIIFGKKSEKRAKDEGRERSSAKEDLLLHAESLVPSPGDEETKDLEGEEIIYDLTDEELMAMNQTYGFQDAQARDWEEIQGLYETATEITVIERTYKKVQHKRKKYRFNPKDETKKKVLDKELIVTAPGPEKLLPGCRYSIDFALSVVTDKYLFHLPLERQRRQMEAAGLKKIAPKTLYNLCLTTATHLEEVAEGIRWDIFKANLAVGCDETPWPIYGKDDDGYLWCMTNQAGNYYRFEPTRQGKVIEEMLAGYQGPILSDGYVGYARLKKLEQLITALCWAHARRKFYELQDDYPKESEEILDLIDALFLIEREAKSFNQLKRLRQEESKPLVDQIYAWLLAKKGTHFRESTMVKAINYLLNHWDGFKAFLKDVRIPLSNNETERGIRQGVMGRKNFYGSRSINGADVAATLYTVIETCKKAELDPKFYIRYVIEQNNLGEDALTPLQYARKIRTAT